jgi:hypothetical protein
MSSILQAIKLIPYSCLHSRDRICICTLSSSLSMSVLMTGSGTSCSCNTSSVSLTCNIITHPLIGVGLPSYLAAGCPNLESMYVCVAPLFVHFCSFLKLKMKKNLLFFITNLLSLCVFFFCHLTSSFL